MHIALTADPEIPVPPLHYGGIERIVDMLARGLSERGHRVTLFANPHSECPVNRIPWPGGSSINAFDKIRNCLSLTTHALTEHFDLIHSFSRIAYMTILLPLPIPKLMTYQRAINLDSVRLGQILSRGTLQFSAISEWMMRDTRHVGRWGMIPNGVSLATYDFRPDTSDAAPLIFLGRIEHIKGPHLAIEIAKRTGSKLVIAGNIPPGLGDWFAKMIAPHLDGEQITYFGAVDDKQKNELLGRARALLMPILWEEPFGIVMAESMACGTPVIGLRRGAVPEVVEDGVTGYIGDSVDELVAAVGRLSLISRAACRERVERLYSDVAVVDGYLRLYEQLVRH